MATQGWRTGQSLIGGIRENIYGFDVLQAIRLLEHWTHNSESGVGETRVRFGSSRQSGFPGAAIEALESDRDRLLVRMAFLGLSGPNAPLPMPYHQWMQDNLGRGDAAMAEFLDIFNHRLIELFFRIRQQYTLGLSNGSWKTIEQETVFCIRCFDAFLNQSDDDIIRYKST